MSPHRAADPTAEGKTRREIMRCLKRYVVREVFKAITNPPDVPTGGALRQARNRAGLTLTQAANAASTTPIQISRLERGLDHNNRLALQLQAWLGAAT